MAIKNISSLITETSTDQRFPLGTEFEQANGDKGYRTWVYVQVEDAAAIGDVMALKLGATTKIVITAPASCARIRCVGVAQHAIADNSFGWILKKGFGSVKTAAAAGVTADTPIVVGLTAGRVIDTANGTVAEQGSIGVSSATVAAATVATAVWIDCPA